MDVILKKATLCLLLGGILAILLLSACTSAESGNSDSIIDKSPSMGADEDNQEASEVTILSVDQPALSLSIPKAWEDIAIIKRQTDIQQSAEAKDGTLLFQLYEKTAYTTDEAMGNVWSLVAFTKDAFKEKFGDADLATVIGVESYVLGSDSDYIYLLVRPSDVQFLENDDTSLKQYKQLQQESQVVLAGFLKDNGLQRTDFNTDYVVQRVDVQGNFAVIEVLENISFQYVGAEDSSFSQKEHTVSLIKVDGEWIVANVETKYDWFANEYKDTEYKISSIIAAEKQNIQAQAECSANEDSVVSAAPAEDEMVAEVLANASFARMYNKENAWKYAYTYATSTTTSTANSYYNTDIFNDYSGPNAGDCMNFASQAIYAGFSGSNNLTSVNAGTAPQDTVGIAAGQTNAAQTKWYAKPASTYWAWTSCGYFRDYIDYSINDTETRLRAVQKPITASSDFSEVGTANLIGSIIHVNGSKPLGHAVIVNNATGTARNQIYFTAHSPNAKNLNLADEYSGQMVSIRPTYFYDVTTCTGANTSHTFSSTNSKCARCGYVRTYIIPTLLIPMAKNTQITLTARTNHTVSSISMSVKNPNGATTNLGTVTNTNSISKVYTPTVAAHPNDLYTVTVTAVSADGVTTSSTWTFRTY